jgi:hypothetical protein
MLQGTFWNKKPLNCTNNPVHSFHWPLHVDHEKLFYEQKHLAEIIVNRSMWLVVQHDGKTKSYDVVHLRTGGFGSSFECTDVINLKMAASNTLWL